MAEPEQIRALIVDDEPDKVDELSSALERAGGLVVAVAISAAEVADMHEAGVVTPEKVDVAFIDGNLGFSDGDGKEVLRYLFICDLARQPFGSNSHRDPVLPAKDRIVTVGSSSNPDWALELGSYSMRLEKALAVNWGSRPVDLTVIADEVRQLRQLS